MVKSANISAIENATGRRWSEWLDWLDNMQAREMNHQEIAAKVAELLDGMVEKPGWWAQGIAIAFEQEIGRRIPGQRSDGTFGTSTSKTLELGREELFRHVVSVFGVPSMVEGQTVLKPRSSETAIRSNWKCDFSGGSKLVVSVEPKPNGKTGLVIRHENIPTNEEAEKWKAHWKRFMEEHFNKDNNEISNF